jgi:hypothetical protein
MDLDPVTPFSVSLLNCRQIYINLEAFLAKKSRSLKVKILEKNGNQKYISIEDALSKQNQSEWRAQLLKWIEEYIGNDIKFETIDIPAKNADLLDFLSAKVVELNNSKYKASNFFQISRDKRSLLCYGLVKNLTRNVAHLKEEIARKANQKASNTNQPPPLMAVPVKAAERTETGPQIEIDSNSLLYLSLFSLESVWNDFVAKLATQKATLHTDSSNTKIFINCPAASVHNVNLLISSFEKNRLLKLNVNLNSYLNLTDSADLEEFKEQISGSFMRPRSLRYQFAKIDGHNYLHVFGYRAAVENFQLEAKKKYLAMIARRSTNANASQTVNSNQMKNPVPLAASNSSNSISSSRSSVASSMSKATNNTSNKPNLNQSINFINEDEIQLNSNTHPVECIMLGKFNSN